MRRSIAVRRAASLGKSACGSLDNLAGDTSALTVGGVEAIKTFSSISVRTSVSLLTVVAVSFDIGATDILRELPAVGMGVADDGDGRVPLSPIVRRVRVGER